MSRLLAGVCRAGARRADELIVGGCALNEQSWERGQPHPLCGYQLLIGRSDLSYLMFLNITKVSYQSEDRSPFVFDLF